MTHESILINPMSEVDDEYAALTTESGRLLLAEVGKIRRPGPADLLRWRRLAPAGVVAAAARLVESRRRGAAKFSRASEMWLARIPLEQATTETVAAHKARRFAGSSVMDLCSGLGGDAIAFASAGSQVVAVDCDQAMGRRLAWNAGVYEVQPRLLAIRGRAETVPVPPSSLVHIDPDRRVMTSQRAKLVRNYAPGFPFLQNLANHSRGGAIKLGPASDFAERFGSPRFEVEVISLDGECKEATVWFGTLASCRRRATCLPSSETWSDRDGSVNAKAQVSSLQDWLYEPDPALCRAGLLDGFALEWGLPRIGSNLDLLTGPASVSSPFLTPFEVQEVLTIDIKRLRRLVSERELGNLDIKTKGIALKPEEIRKQLKPAGSGRATLFLLGGEKGRAILAERVGRHDQNEVANPGE